MLATRGRDQLSIPRRERDRRAALGLKLESNYDSVTHGFDVFYPARGGLIVVEIKLLSREGIPGALDKALRYRLLGQPWEAESIYLDVLQADSTNQPALVGLLLALTDQFEQHLSGIVGRAQEVVPRISDDYERAYYTGIISERRAKAVLHRGRPGADRMAHSLLREAMAWFERAEALRPPGDDDALLRWNACARLLQRHPNGDASGDERFEPYTDA
jgi:hypothetical protein